MTALQNNPFHKPNPFTVVRHDRFEHPHLQSGRQPDYAHLIYKERGIPKPIENNWTFNENNVGRKVDFSRKYEMTASQVSDFEMKMKMSAITTAPHARPRVVFVQDAKLENPFFRKNLIVDKEEVKNQVELDLSIYRNRTSSNYEPKPTYEEPALRPKISSTHENNVGLVHSQYIKDPQYVRDSPGGGELSYSKTPEATQRQERERENPEGDSPQVINWRGKRFYLQGVE